MAIWSQYMRDKDALEKAACPSCHGSGMETHTDYEEGMIICGAAICGPCGGAGYAMKVQALDHLEAEMRAVGRGDIPCPPDDAVPSREPKKHTYEDGWDDAMDWCAYHGLIKDGVEIPKHAPGTVRALRDYSASELMAEYMRRDGCG